MKHGKGKKIGSEGTQAQPLMLSIQATPDVSAIRTAELFEDEYTVIPCIALVEGVLWPANAPAPELALAEEFGRFPEGWNGRPVVYDHPRIDGIAVSASSPDVLELNAIGQMFNTTLKDNKLKTEIWINNARAESLPEEAQEVIENLKAGDEVVEVSTGLFTMNEMIDGEHDGQEYSAIWRNIVPDHLAVLPKGIKGACSVEDGCGAPRTNMIKPVMRAAQLNANLETNCSCMTDNAEDSEQSVFQRILSMAGGILKFKGNAGELSDSDLRTALAIALNAERPDSYFFILAVYPEGNSGNFVYEQGFDGTLNQRSFTIDGDSVSISEETVAVRPVTQFVPVEVIVNESITPTDNQENDMNVDELVNGLIANQATQFTEDDREWLAAMNEEQLTRLSPVTNADGEGEGDGEGADGEGEGEGEGEAPSVNAQGATTTQEYIDQAPEEVRDALNSAVRLQRSRKAALVKQLSANSRCTFSTNQLNAKNVDELEQLAELADIEVTFEGQGGTLTPEGLTDNEEGVFTPAPSIFDLDASNAA